MKNRIIRVVSVASVLALLGTAGSALPAQADDAEWPSSWLAEEEAEEVVETQEMYRLYNRVSSEHLYTADSTEVDVLTRGDWVYEGVGWVAPKESDAPVYRLYNPGLGDHHYTMDANEVKALVKRHGWKDEGIGWYSSQEKEVPVYRQYNPGLKTGSHNYTTDATEYKVNNERNGWQGEGEAWYAISKGQAEAGGQGSGSYYIADDAAADTAANREKLVAFARTLIGDRKSVV